MYRDRVSMRTRFTIFALIFLSGLSAAWAGEGTNLVVFTNPSTNLTSVTNQIPVATNAPTQGQLFVQTIDTQIADLETEKQDVEVRRAPLLKAQAQRRSQGLAPDPTDELNLARLNDGLNYITNQLQLWQHQRAVFLQTRGLKPQGPRPVAPPK
jgi:hypothetical protein